MYAYMCMHLCISECVYMNVLSLMTVPTTEYIFPCLSVEICVTCYVSMYMHVCMYKHALCVFINIYSDMYIGVYTCVLIWGDHHGSFECKDEQKICSAGHRVRESHRPKPC